MSQNFLSAVRRLIDLLNAQATSGLITRDILVQLGVVGMLLGQGREGCEMSNPSLSRQSAAINATMKLLRSGSKPARPVERDMLVKDLVAALQTLEWLAANEAEIKRLMKEAKG